MKRVGSTVCLEAPQAIRGMGRRVISEFWKVDQDRAWVVEESYDVASENVGRLFDFTKPLGTIKQGLRNGGSDR